MSYRETANILANALEKLPKKDADFYGEQLMHSTLGLARAKTTSARIANLLHIALASLAFLDKVVAINNLPLDEMLSTIIDSLDKEFADVTR